MCGTSLAVPRKRSCHYFLGHGTESTVFELCEISELTPVAAVIVAALLGVGLSGVTGPTFLLCPVVIGELGPPWVPLSTPTWGQ